MDKDNIAIYHRIMKRENFEVAAKDLFRLLKEAQRNEPDKARILYVDIDGHRNEAGGFDQDMFELQKEFGIGFLLQFFQEVHFTLVSVKNSEKQNNNIPEELQIFEAENKKDTSLDDLYIENYSNTEFMSEQNVYNYLKHFSNFLKDYNEYDDWNKEYKREKFDKNRLISLWYSHLKELIVELFNNFIYGNLLSVAAMTRTLIECYVYVSILMKEQSNELSEEWFLCSLMMKVKKNDNLESKAIEKIKSYCKESGLDFEEVYNRFPKNNENAWLTRVIKKKRVTFHDACEYLGEVEIYEDYQHLCAFVHGQDIYSKMMPFTFYSSIYSKLYIMSSYIFKSLRIFKIDEKLENTINMLEEELWELGAEYL